MGLTSLESMGDFMIINHNKYKQYQQELSNIRGINSINSNEKEQCNYQYVIVKINELIAGINCEKLYQIWLAENILVKRYFDLVCHQIEPLRSRIADMDLMLTNTRYLAARVLALATGTAIVRKEISKICQILKLATTRENRINEKLYENFDAC